MLSFFSSLETLYILIIYKLIFENMINICFKIQKVSLLSSFQNIKMKRYFLSEYFSIEFATTLNRTWSHRYLGAIAVPLWRRSWNLDLIGRENYRFYVKRKGVIETVWLLPLLLLLFHYC